MEGPCHSRLEQPILQTFGNLTVTNNINAGSFGTINAGANPITGQEFYNTGSYHGTAGTTGGAYVRTRDGNHVMSISAAGGLYLDAPGTLVKTFVIDHPNDKDKYLVHGTLEGPEGAVYYRGTASLTMGIAKVKLPDYFESLTRDDGITIQLTAVNGFDPIAVFDKGGQVHDGNFIVMSNNKESFQKFNWEVKAVRADVEKLVIEPAKSKMDLHGDGPYTYATPKK